MHENIGQDGVKSISAAAARDLLIGSLSVDPGRARTRRPAQLIKGEITAFTIESMNFAYHLAGRN